MAKKSVIDKIQDFNKAGTHTRAELETYYKSLAKVADQRLIRLEKLAASGKEHYKGVLSYSYKRAQHDIEAWNKVTKQSTTRFNTKAPSNYQQLQAKIKDIEHFILAPTSTKSGITSIYEKRTKTTNDTYGTNFTWQELATFFENENADKIDGQYGSKTMIKAIGVIKRVGSNPKHIKNVIEKHKVLSPDAVVDEIAYKLLESGITAADLFT